ncbi:hypothetical protein [Massilia rubra]|uniref:Uncharacterized protein n=1 Tax=Massilia rubra TaxID=2607910 RepID=A0ABX0LN52_9BURK|nr:hypothetical protein [Massilia rubra]NHZ34113.1 hypothetical protein [Massilia rubra]
MNSKYVWVCSAREACRYDANNRSSPTALAKFFQGIPRFDHSAPNAPKGTGGARLSKKAVQTSLSDNDVRAFRSASDNIVCEAICSIQKSAKVKPGDTKNPTL